MEEAAAADLVLHVIDQSHPQYEEQRTVGEDVLRDLGVSAERVVEVYNKSDRIEDHAGTRRRNSVSVSALTGRNIDRLVGMIRDRELARGQVMHLDIPHTESRIIAKLHEVAEIAEQSSNDESARFVAWVPNE